MRLENFNGNNAPVRSSATSQSSQSSQSSQDFFAQIAKKYPQAFRATQIAAGAQPGPGGPGVAPTPLQYQAQADQGTLGNPSGPGVPPTPLGFMHPAIDNAVSFQQMHPDVHNLLAAYHTAMAKLGAQQAMIKGAQYG